MDDWITAAQFAVRCGVSGARVRHWLAEGRIVGARQHGRRIWMIPQDAERPPDKRIGRPRK